MITKELINEINELSRKQRSVGLTPEEKGTPGRAASGLSGRLSREYEECAG